MKGNVIVTKIQRMCMHDGPGIRTTVFLKGCNLHCPWCANPETINPLPEPYDLPDGRIGIYGEEYGEEDLWQEILKDRGFWRNGGGVTFSGGEPLLQLRNIEQLLKRLKCGQIHIAVETALQVPTDILQACLDYIDLFIVDIKILDDDLCNKVLGGNLQCYYSNLKLLKEKHKEILFRLPCSREYTVTENNCRNILNLLKQYPSSQLEIFALHTLGKSKYESLHREYRNFVSLSEESLRELGNRFSVWGNQVRVSII